MAIGDINNHNDSPLGTTDYRPPVDPKTTPQNGEILVYSAAEKAWVHSPNVATNSFTVTDDAGSGDVASDVNNTDFTGQSPVVGQAASIPLSSFTTFVHKIVAYNWVGPKNVTVGIGGSYVATAGDFASVGTADHNLLQNKTAPDQHPTSSITGLDADQASQDIATAQVQTNLDIHIADQNDPHNVQHSQLADASDPNLHPTSSISGLDADQAAQDAATAQVQTNLDTHIAAPDPHTQYVLNSEGLAVWTGAGYGGILRVTPVSIPDIAGGYTVLTADTAMISSPKGVSQDVAGNALTFSEIGIWLVNVAFTIEHNSSNQGRTFNIRMYNTVDSAVIGSAVIGVGRNVEATSWASTLLVEITPDRLNDTLQIQVGGGDTFSSVIEDSFSYNAIRVNEANGL